MGEQPALGSKVVCQVESGVQDPNYYFAAYRCLSEAEAKARELALVNGPCAFTIGQGAYGRSQFDSILFPSFRFLPTIGYHQHLDCIGRIL
ncbi:hypothetical protein N7468_001432 [Penicillium chermesinum]|uniref:Uncharacterized protein n=1 Tax=Penicillium chermesinum TaxID=63820 RepID=A0A9W9PGS5_9EURO|nr:uncharacterized protein N7468_001432 [Penicillium chermesinum]KAJ5246449.1 hypothetical protein N7468_001432 [Penicillium chermesinum]